MYLYLYLHTHTHTLISAGGGLGWSLVPSSTAAVRGGIPPGGDAPHQSKSHPVGSSLGGMLCPRWLCRACGRALGSVSTPRICINSTTWSLKPGKPAATFSCLLCQARPIDTKAPGPRATAGRPNGEAGQSRGGELGSSRLFSPCTRCTWRGLSGTTTRSGYREIHRVLQKEGLAGGWEAKGMQWSLLCPRLSPPWS